MDRPVLCSLWSRLVFIVFNPSWARLVGEIDMFALPTGVQANQAELEAEISQGAGCSV